MNDPQEPAHIQWRKAFETGDPAIDHEHREMISRINGFLISLNTEPETDLLVHQLGDIYALITAHFALEEKHMRDQGYKAYAVHKQDHEKLLDDLRDLMDDLEQAAFTKIRETIGHRISHWFIHHFSTHDARWHCRPMDGQ